MEQENKENEKNKERKALVVNTEEKALQTEEKQSNKDEEGGYSVTTLILGLAGVFLVVLLGYLGFKTMGGTDYKKVDLLTITQNLKDDARKLALKDGVTEAQQGAILENLQKQMNEIHPILLEEAKKCNCTIFIQSAIVADGSKTEDITQIVLDKVRSAK